MKILERREEILRILATADAPVKASEMAERFGVTRQVIVSDIALLRAQGHKIVSEKRGYYTEKADFGTYPEVIVCRHAADGILPEFYAIVDNGGKVKDIMVDHPIYGEIRAELHIASRYDAEDFVRRLKDSNAAQLCEVTGGVHYHTITVPDKAAYQRIIAALKEQGILVEQTEENC